jgi:hypothetical protein
MRALRTLGWGLLLGGFWWAVMQVLLFPGDKFALMLFGSLPPESAWTKEQTFNALLELGKRLAAVQREMLVPVSLMLVGGIVLGLRRRPEKGPAVEKTQP